MNRAGSISLGTSLQWHFAFSSMRLARERCKRAVRRISISFFICIYTTDAVDEVKCDLQSKSCRKICAGDHDRPVMEKSITEVRIFEGAAVLNRSHHRPLLDLMRAPKAKSHKYFCLFILEH